MPIGPIAVVDPKFPCLDLVGGVEGANATAPLGQGRLTVMPFAMNVLAGGLPVAVVGTGAPPHGNPINPLMPGYNPMCFESEVVEGIPTILVNNLPVALAGPMGSLTTCGHWVNFPNPVVLKNPITVGGALG
jgi:uncharacterized Zn-binding protein involved in type VI secretion